MYNVVNMPDLVVRYFSSNLWLGAFIVSGIYLFFRCNTDRKRAILGAVVAFFLVINAYVIEKFSNLGENATFYRHLWAIPTIAIIGFAVVDLIRIMPKWFLKIPVIAAFSVFIWFANQEYIRCREQIFSTDAKMIQEEAITLADGFKKLKDETGKNTLFVVCPSGYSIPYGDLASELNLYSGIINISPSSVLNDAEHNGDEELMGDNPNIPFIMSTCCSKGMDYVISANNDSANDLFEAAGYYPVFSSKSFRIYACNGYCGYTQDNTNLGQTSIVSFYDENGNARRTSQGYSTIKYFYNERGKKTREEYRDIDGKLCNNEIGYSAIEFGYNEKGYIQSKKYLGNDNKYIIFRGRVETRYEYDDKNRVFRESYFNDNGLPMNRTDLLFAIKEIGYNEKDSIISEKYYDNQLNLKKSTLGYASFLKEVDDNYQIIAETYYAEDNTILAEIRNGKEMFSGNVFRFFHCSDGVSIQNDGIITMSTMITDNRFNLVHFQLLDARSGEYLFSFGEKKEKGIQTGQCSINYPSGLYWLTLKGNSNISDESLRCLIYISEGSVLKYNYTIDIIEDKEIQVRDVEVFIE